MPDLKCLLLAEAVDLGARHVDDGGEDLGQPFGQARLWPVSCSSLRAMSLPILPSRAIASASGNVAGVAESVATRLSIAIAHGQLPVADQAAAQPLTGLGVPLEQQQFFSATGPPGGRPCGPAAGGR